MTTPRIGDTVHYTRGTPERPVCRAAIVTGYYRPPHPDLIELGTDGQTVPRRCVPYDTEGAETGFTPHTWHHIH